MTDKIQEYVRVVTHETLKGTYYIAEKYEYTFRLFSESKYEWIPFCIRKYDSGRENFEDLKENEKQDDVFKDVKVAEYYCEEYIRVGHSDKVIKTWGSE